MPRPDEIKLHLGCGSRYIPGFVHVDVCQFPHIDHVRDIRDLGNFPDNSACLIYACQVLTYFDRQEVGAILAEWTRVLAPGGILRLSLPDFAVLSRLYQAGLSLDWLLGTLYGRIPGPDDSYLYHRTTYDEASATQVLTEAGLTQIRRWDWRQTEHAHVDDFSQAYFPHMEKERGLLFNLNIEGIKPVGQTQ